jgi:hypothetical protein
VITRNLLLLSLAVVGISGLGCGDKNESVLALPDLSIPEYFELLGPDGKPLPDSIGQPVRDLNEFYYNHRTGEFFTHLSPPVMGLIVGDILDIGTQVFNDSEDKPDAICADAPQTTANSVLLYSGPAASDSIALAPGIVPPVSCNDASLTYATIQFNSPGTYKIYFAANHDRKVPEHDYSNNYTAGASPSMFDRSTNGGIAVSEGVASGPWASSNIPTREVAWGACFRQFDSGTMLANYLDSPLARFMQKPGYMADFVKFKAENPGKPFLLN